jgi:Pentapeptide repeats (8 copies)
MHRFLSPIHMLQKMEQGVTPPDPAHWSDGRIALAASLGIAVATGLTALLLGREAAAAVGLGLLAVLSACMTVRLFAVEARRAYRRRQRVSTRASRPQSSAPLALGNVLLSDSDLTGIDLAGARLSGAALAGSDLSDAMLDGSQLSNARLERARLDGARMQDARLDGARLDGAMLIDADLRGADLTGADLRGADLTGANLEHAELERVRTDDRTVWPGRRPSVYVDRPWPGPGPY